MSPQFDTSIAQTLGVYFLCPDMTPLTTLPDVDALSGSLWVGFRYIDAQAGASVNVELLCNCDNRGELLKTEAPMDNGARWVFRSGVLDDLPALVLNETQIASLGLPIEPEWLKFYHLPPVAKGGELVRGRALNSAGKWAEALPVLEKAWQETPNHPSIAFEILFAYNAGGVSQKTLEWLGKLEEESPVWESALVWREIGFALGTLKQWEHALSAYRKTLDLLGDDNPAQKAEVAYNAGAIAHQIGDSKTRDHLWSLAWQNAPQGSMIRRQIQSLLET